MRLNCGVVGRMHMSHPGVYVTRTLSRTSPGPNEHTTIIFQFPSSNHDNLSLSLIARTFILNEPLLATTRTQQITEFVPFPTLHAHVPFRTLHPPSHTMRPTFHVFLNVFPLVDMFFHLFRDPPQRHQ